MESIQPSTAAGETDRNPLIRICNLTKTYEEGSEQRVVLDQVSAEIYQGEILVLMGRSGSGKSTLLNLISAIDLPTSGEIAIRKTNLSGLDERAQTLFRRENIGFVYQFFNLIPTLTVEENLLLPLELKGEKVTSGHGAAQTLLEAVGLQDRKDSFPDRLSGGEQQRVAIARALIHDPPLILADEPTGNLDYETGSKVADLLDRLVRQHGKTLIVATHSRELMHMADRVLIVRKGKLIPHTGKEMP